MMLRYQARFSVTTPASLLPMNLFNNIKTNSVFDGWKGSPILADLLRKHIGENYTLSAGVNPVSALEIVLTPDRSR